MPLDTNRPRTTNRLQEELTEEQKIAKHIEAMGHSEQLVRELISQGIHSERIHKDIKRNIDHLSYMLGKPEISNSGSPQLAGFQEAVELGQEFIEVEVEE